ncbi:MAG: hypothetical protein H6603_00700 [Flavobacteriales bacterium]|nr:hypothetical protein [Flavobacteriales bacterium]MCB9191120.1 hypothetical protein [Flavobacteriales bacterium]MCB9203466.1 hypothetical protein [Flavobacteriales bacterium]
MCAQRKEIEFLTDQPIKSIDDDKFGRGEFVKAIAEVIHSQTTEVNPDNNPDFKDIDENMIVGLYGSWGSGKSSIMHMLEHELNQSHVQTTFFNPWMYNSEEHLITSLFNSIIELSGFTGTSRDELVALIKKYQPILSLASKRGDKLVDAVSLIGDKEVSVNALACKDQIDKMLVGNANPLVIFIDDVDRLSKDEIHVLFKTLRLIASFKNVIYVVAFDFDMVSQSIKENYADGRVEDGQAFIEKIVQIPVRIPEIREDALLGYFIDLVSKTFQFDLSNHDLFRSLFKSCISTPRDVKRFINGFRFTFHYLKETIPSKDLICIELIRSKNHFLFQLIKLHYRSIKNRLSIVYYRAQLSKFFEQNAPHLLKPDKNGSLYPNEHNEDVRLFNEVFRSLLGTQGLIHPDYDSVQGRLDIPKYLDYIESDMPKTFGEKIPESLENPLRLLDYFEKVSVEINQ